jgi:hypothetical protein
LPAAALAICLTSSIGSVLGNPDGPLSHKRFGAGLTIGYWRKFGVFSWSRQENWGFLGGRAAKSPVPSRF